MEGALAGEMQSKDLVVHVIRTDDVRLVDHALLAERMPTRYEKAMRFAREQDRLLCLGAGLLMMDALGIQDEREICYGPCGKPYVPGMPEFSISHSGSVCILACGNVAHLGADVEEIDERHLDIASAVYTKAELAWMDADPVERFFRLWTWKECVMKATGMGMYLEPPSFEVLPFAEGRPALVGGHTWYAWDTALKQYRISVCADGPIGHVRVREFEGTKQ